MKNFNYYAVIFLLFLTGCESNDVPITPTAGTTFENTFSITAPQTNGSSNAFEKSETISLSDQISNSIDISSIKVDKITYQFKNFSGNTNAVAKSLFIKVNDIEVANLVDLNINTVVSSGTVYSVDAALLSSLESSLLSKTNSSYQVSGSVLTDEGEVSFDIDVSIKITATL